MTRGAGLGPALLAALATPSTWVLALVAFLLRGGLVVLLVPIITIPSAVGFGNLLGPTITELVLGDARSTAILLGLATFAAASAWLVIGGWLAAAAEVEAIRRIALDEEVGVGIGLVPANLRHAAWRVLVARLVLAVPLILALAVGGVQVVLSAYRELTVPSDTAIPLVARVIAGASQAIALIVVAWIVGELLSGIAARWIVLRSDGVVRGLVAALGHVIRRPVPVLVGWFVPTAGLVAVVVPSAMASGSAWAALRTILADGDEPLVATLLVALLVALWLGGLVLVGLTSAWRGAVWTVQVAGTFGGVTERRPGEWSDAGMRGTLGGLRPDGAEPTRGEP